MQVNVQWKGSEECPLLEHNESARGISIVFCPGITGEALKWNSSARPPPPTLSAGIPLTVKRSAAGELTKPLM